MGDTVDAPSGVTLPFLLLEEWQSQVKQEDGRTSVSISSHFANSETSSSIEGTAASVNVQALSSQELEHRIRSIGNFVIADLHKQIQRGEEAYYDDTYGHGNLFRGWESFVDSKDIGGGGATSQQPGSRRIPADCRWFSGSCSEILRIRCNSVMSGRGNPSTAELPVGATGCPESLSASLSAAQNTKRMSFTNESTTSTRKSPLFVGYPKETSGVHKPRGFSNPLPMEKPEPDHSGNSENKKPELPAKRKLRTDIQPGLLELKPSAKKKVEDKNLLSSKDVPKRQDKAAEDSSFDGKKKPVSKTMEFEKDLKVCDDPSQDGKQPKYADGGRKEERSKREEPSKRRSSRNRKAA